ncbi:disease resistance protein like isoform X1 [Capsicum annuum]|uniref:disease resistance protein At4g27190-like isoform X1 n=1 Tax=Capsicum annuum TaxID=4072 RepID=UPI001FB06201|nr:disease resistance protein At4g27190-like isoform X1 [Capsicum annuum]
MEIIATVVSTCVVEVGRFMCRCIYPKIENVVCFSLNIDNLRKEMEQLTEFRDDIEAKVEVAVREGYKPNPAVIKWIKDVHELEKEWESMQESITAAKSLTYKCCPKCSLRSEVSTQARNIRDQLCRLKEVGENHGSNLVIENYQMKKVEHIPGPSIEGQPAATRNLNELLRLLEDDKVCIIGVWGTGGVGKTTLVKNLNNELLKNVPSSKLSFGVVIWVTVPKPPIDVRKIQEQIASRLNLTVDNEASVESIASKICERLEKETSFLLILDDVWEAINLDYVGVPQPEYPARSKVIITSRFLDVCKQMRTDVEMKVYTLEEDESWQLFAKNVGDIVNLEQIHPLAKEIARECDGLPLAITVVGSSMRGKTKVELWEDALKSLSMSEPHSKVVEDKVYKVIKWSFDSLESQDIELSSEQRRKHVNKKRGDIRSCFLYCSLYPAAIPTDDLIHCWWAEGILGEHDMYEEAYNRGITLIESLKDACLLEANKMHYVKMHDVVRDVAIWIASTFGNEQTFVFQAGIGLTEISCIKISASVKRISFISNEIECLPDCFTKCPKTTSLLLQDNEPLYRIPPEFFLAFPDLRVLNLRGNTSIRALPSSINSLCQLRALILKNCSNLKKLPPVANLHNLQVLDCDNTELRCLPQGMDNLTNLRLLNMTNPRLLTFPRDGNLSRSCLGATSFDEISSLQNLTYLSIRVDNSSCFNRDYTWMTRLKGFLIKVGETSCYAPHIPYNKSKRVIKFYKCEIFSYGELSGMLQFASDLYLDKCMGLRKLISYNTFNGLKLLNIYYCFCSFEPVEGGSGQFDPLPNLEYLVLESVENLKSISAFCQYLGLRFSKLRQLNISYCPSLTCLFNDGGTCSVPKHLEEITVDDCRQLVELFVRCSSSDQATLVNSEIPRVLKLSLYKVPQLGSLGEPQSIWEHLEELTVNGCDGLRKLPLSIQTSENIKIIKGKSAWWSQLEWDDENFKANLEHSYKERQN